MNWTVALRLGRVSNLPTVWTNVLAGTVLAGSIPTPFPMGLLLLAISLFYVAGMYLNDAFDRQFDASEENERQNRQTLPHSYGQFTFFKRPQADNKHAVNDPKRKGRVGRTDFCTADSSFSLR